MGFSPMTKANAASSTLQEGGRETRIEKCHALGGEEGNGRRWSWSEWTSSSARHTPKFLIQASTRSKEEPDFSRMGVLSDGSE